MSQENGQAREDQFLGTLLGAAIGDALGRSIDETTTSGLTDSSGGELSYGPATESGPEGGGAITYRSEIVLCLVESLTTNEGRPDPDNMVARMAFLAAGPSRELMSSAMIEGIELAVEHDGQVQLSTDSVPELAVATRGIPVGLLHAVGGFDVSALEREAVVVTRLSHEGEHQEGLTTAVARAVAETSRHRAIPDSVDVPDGEQGAALSDVLVGLSTVQTFDEGMRVALEFDVDRISMGMIGGALLGARFGASGIPQNLIDELDARIYLSLAAPWFYRTSIMRAGTVIDLRQIS